MLFVMDHICFDLINVQVYHFDLIKFLQKIKVMTPKQVSPWVHMGAVANSAVYVIWM